MSRSTWALGSTLSLEANFDIMVPLVFFYAWSENRSLLLHWQSWACSNETGGPLSNRGTNEIKPATVWRGICRISSRGRWQTSWKRFLQSSFFFDHKMRERIPNSPWSPNPYYWCWGRWGWRRWRCSDTPWPEGVLGVAQRSERNARRPSMKIWDWSMFKKLRY